jgi:hypothetical protein
MNGKNVKIDFDSGSRIELDGEWCSVFDSFLKRTARVPREEMLRFVHVFIGAVIEDACECEQLGSTACVWSDDEEDDDD